VVLAGAVLLAGAANAYEILCTAGLPVVYTRVLTLQDLSPAARYGWLALYNAIYVVPLAAVVGAFAATLGSRKLGEREGRALKLLSALMLLGLGGVLVVDPGGLESPLAAIGLLAAAGGGTALGLWLAARVRRRGRR